MAVDHGIGRHVWDLTEHDKRIALMVLLLSAAIFEVAQLTRLVLVLWRTTLCPRQLYVEVLHRLLLLAHCCTILARLDDTVAHVGHNIVRYCVLFPSAFSVHTQ